MISRYPIVSRGGDEILFRTPAETVTADRFLHAAHRLAEALPGSSAIVNLCLDRFRFAVGFAAAMIAFIFLLSLIKNSVSFSPGSGGRMLEPVSA